MKRNSKTGSTTLVTVTVFLINIIYTLLIIAMLIGILNKTAKGQTGVVNTVQEAKQTYLLTQLLKNAYDTYKTNEEMKKTLQDIKDKAELAEDAYKAYEITLELVELSEKLQCMTDELANTVDLADELNFSCHDDFKLFSITQDLSIQAKGLKYLLAIHNIKKTLTNNGGFTEYIKTCESIRRGFINTFDEMEYYRNQLLQNLISTYGNKAFLESLIAQINREEEEKRERGRQMILQRMLSMSLFKNELSKVKGVEITKVPDYEKRAETEVKKETKNIVNKLKPGTEKTKSLVKGIISVVLLIGLVFVIYNITTSNPKALSYVISFIVALIVAAIAYALIK